MCCSWNQSTNFRWNAFHRSFTELLQFTKENDAIMLILPNYTTVAFHPRDRRIFGLFKICLQQYVNLRFNTYQSRKVLGVHLGTVISEVWKKGASTANSVSAFKATGILPLYLNYVPDNSFSICGSAETGAETEFAS